MEYQLPEPFARTGLGADDAPPRVFGSPLRYVQADGIIDRVGPYLQRLGYTRPAVLLSARSRAAEGGRVVEANTLLSGLGYENGGLAAAHAFAQAYTVIPRVHHRYLHGEMVALGTLTQLVLESRMDAAEKLAQFGSGIGLPVQLAQLGLSRDDDAELTAIVDAALAFPFIGNMPCETSAERLHAALLHADELGCLITDQYGAEAYHRIHPVEA